MGLINSATLAQMKSTSILINVARRPVIEPVDLHEALKTKTIRGAIIDTWYVYPTPNQPNPSPAPVDFSSLDDVIMTPHCAAWTHPHHRRRWQAVAENFDRLARPDPLLNSIKL